MPNFGQLDITGVNKFFWQTKFKTTIVNDIFWQVKLQTIIVTKGN